MYVCLLRVLNQYGTHWNKNTPTTAMIRTVGQAQLCMYISGVGVDFRPFNDNDFLSGCP